MESPQRIGDYPFDISYMNYDESKYEEFLRVKHNEMRSRFQDLWASVGLPAETNIEIDVVRSPPRHCRQKCRFAIRRKADLSVTAEPEDELVHAMWDEGRPTVVVDAFPIASSQIFNTMPILLRTIQTSPQYACMVQGFASVHYLSTLSGSLTITMNYDTSNSESFQDESGKYKCLWRIAAEQLRDELVACAIPTVTSLSLIGRSKGVKVVVGEDFVMERLHLADGRSLRYKQVEEGFSNPNSAVNRDALGWLCSVAQQAVSSGRHADEGAVERKVDLLEMYCGNGNHTVALAAYFNQVMGVEINPALCAAAEENFAINGITNAKVVVCDSGRFATQILRTKKYILYTQVPASEESSTQDSNADTAAIEGAEGPQHGGCGAESNPAAAFCNKSTAQLRATKSKERQQQKGRGGRRGGPKVVKVPQYEFNFGAVLVDPPRCGLDKLTLSLVASYEHIVYISCSPESLMRDLRELLKTHDIQRLALFDQFAYTPHIETGVWLRAKQGAH